MNRDFVLKTFMNKLNEAKRQNVKDVKLSMKEMDDLGFCIYELLSEYYSKTIDNIKNSDIKNDNEMILDGGVLKK